jgi:hypothetical protein
MSSASSRDERTLAQPDGQITDFLSSPFRKNIPIPGRPKSLHILCHPVSFRGAFRDRHERGRRDAMDADGALTNALEADGKDVWS